MATCVSDIERLEAARKRYWKLPSTQKLLGDRREQRDRVTTEAKAAREAEASWLEWEAEEQLRAALSDKKVPFHERYVRFGAGHRRLEIDRWFWGLVFGSHHVYVGKPDCRCRA